ncbi:uncharacterized membrane protein YtjA (UPF0391 family) [Dyadobacter sp. BE34]|uniref:Uncharacterized membrane protein YtjA (UPF0391 family) n=2 Tax=Spirosomataceae TaxID=2896860 RepID=A0ABU1R144_9BACT|nr:uncharacterized membrane protein YtjA (UPF0391 family) [Dyadobacter fermentans]MDR7044874.1 uncharacterized membrane protein YtjA (UPF0391 family) [Dyadobacter sp. BE242]MDR7199390.1 uncharacterized membrane protein YtjA (UPF0391 family) [Dyadobacter sp. BE34]MDR7217350.1 uncharacterized membrane protein YtjA (UPF0391 family) [Dyadobacter sp. BE31]
MEHFGHIYASGIVLVIIESEINNQKPKYLSLMLRWTVIFLVIAIVAGILGFGGIAAGAAGIAKILFFVFLVLFVLSLLSRGVGRS